MTFCLETERLILREWQNSDLDEFLAIRQDPRVMATLGPLQSREEVAAIISRMQKFQSDLGHCFWVVEHRKDNRLIGWCGLIRGGENTPVAGKLEIGWTLASGYWGHGYATEAANTALDWALSRFPHETVWSITSVSNRKSRAVMDKLGLTYLPELDFDHPKVDPDSNLLRHVTYRYERTR